MATEELKEQARGALQELMKTDYKEKAQLVGKYMGQLVNKDIAALGDNEVFALRDSKGRIIGTRQAVMLSEADGTLTQPVRNGPFTISAFGYQRLAEGAGAQVINAPTVVVDGVEQPNPFCRRDEQGNVIEVHCRALAFRYGKGGQPVVSDRTAVFDLVTYLKTDMIGKAKYCPQAFRLRPKGQPPTEDGFWCEYNIDFAVSLYLNAGHEEAVKFLGQTLNRQKKAMEFAQTFAQRNALKHLFGIDKTPEDGKWSQWRVEMTAYRPEHGGNIGFTAAQFMDGVKQIENVISGDADTPPAKVISGTDTIETESDILDGADAEDIPEVQHALFSGGSAQAEAPAAAPAETQENVEESTEEEKRNWQNLQVAKKEFAGEYEAALKKLAVTEEEVNPQVAGAVLRAIDMVLDEQV
jgi:hypothetical protein